MYMKLAKLRKEKSQNDALHKYSWQLWRHIPRQQVLHIGKCLDEMMQGGTAVAKMQHIFYLFLPLSKLTERTIKKRPTKREAYKKFVPTASYGYPCILQATLYTVHLFFHKSTRSHARQKIVKSHGWCRHSLKTKKSKGSQKLGHIHIHKHILAMSASKECHFTPNTELRRWNSMIFKQANT